MDKRVMQIRLPYGKDTLPLDIPDNNLLDVVLPREIIPPERSESMIKGALNDPLGTDRLSEIACMGDKVAIVVDDYTRPCPTKKLLPPVLEELKKAEVCDSDVLIIVATGTHKSPSFETIREIVGDKVSRNYTIISNDNVNGDYVSVGISKNGNEIEILKDYVAADIKILIGDIEYHYFAGYGGTRKSVLPGIASKNTIQNNHSMLFEKNSATGVLKRNPIHQEMNEAMHLAGCDFALNAVLNSNHQIVGTWAGRPEPVFDAGVKLVDSMYKIEVKEKPDIIFVSANGYPHDINLYQSMKAMHTACQVAKENGVIVLVSECKDGHGSELYIDWLNKYKTAHEIQTELEKNFIIGAHKAYYHREAIENHSIIFVSSMDKSYVEDTFGFEYANSPNDALKKAFEIAGMDARVLVVPQGTTTHLVHES